jgi:hypothetical protein
MCEPQVRFCESRGRVISPSYSTWLVWSKKNYIPWAQGKLRLNRRFRPSKFNNLSAHGILAFMFGLISWVLCLALLFGSVLGERALEFFYIFF